MNIPKSKLSIKGQTTIPSEVRAMFNLKPNCQIMWISLRPGEVSLLPAPKEKSKKSWAESLYGKYKTPGSKLVDDFISDKKKEIELEKRSFLNE